MLKTATIVGRGHPSFLSFAHFSKTFFHHSVLFFLFSFALLFFDIFLVNYLETRRHCQRKTTSSLKKLLLGNLKTNRERVILLSSQNKIKKKNSLFIDQSTFSNFALYVINGLIRCFRFKLPDLTCLIMITNIYDRPGQIGQERSQLKLCTSWQQPITFNYLAHPRNQNQGEFLK